MPPISPEVLDLVQPGKAVRVFYNKGNPNNEIRHIRAIVDDEWVAYRVWNKRRGWRYNVEWLYRFELEYRGGNLKVYKSRKK